jgi:hypothetical protein
MTDLKKWSVVIGQLSLGKSFSFRILLFTSKFKVSIVKLPSFINRGAKIF